VFLFRGGTAPLKKGVRNEKRLHLAYYYLVHVSMKNYYPSKNPVPPFMAAAMPVDVSPVCA
jgi:hypothetical protein